MRAVVQRVSEARVEVDGQVAGAIEKGLMVLLGVAKDDTEADAEYLAAKIKNLRIFEDAAGKMNLNLLDAGGSLLVVSQFTLLADTRKGNRPGFEGAAPLPLARLLYECFVNKCRESVHTQTGVFQADMRVHLVNQGPVTLLLDTKKVASTSVRHVCCD